MNFDLSKPEEPIQKRYLSILSSHNLNQHVKKPTRKTAILDHIITNSIAKVKNVYVIPCPDVSDHDAPYITLSTKFAPLEPRYKIIRDMKNFPFLKTLTYMYFMCYVLSASYSLKILKTFIFVDTVCPNLTFFVHI